MNNNKRTWYIEDHVCRFCAGGRILKCASNQGMSPGGNPLYKCSDCGKTVFGMDCSNLCWCGQAFKNQFDNAYTCLSFKAIETHPYPDQLRNAFLSCGCDPSGKRTEVGILLKESYRKSFDKPK
jgi:hypothetical protein